MYIEHPKDMCTMQEFSGGQSNSLKNSLAS